MRKLIAILLAMLMLIPAMPLSISADPATETADWNITKAIGSNRRYLEANGFTPQSAYDGFNAFWTYNTGSSYNNSESFEAIELKNVSGQSLNLYDYGLAYTQDKKNHVISKYNPFLPGNMIRPDSTWTWTNTPDGQPLLNPVDANSTNTLTIAPGEVVVIWIVNGNTTGSSAHMKETSFAHFRGFLGIADNVKVIAVDGHTSQGSSFNFANGAHNEVGVYKQAEVNTTLTTNTMLNSTESWITYCGKGKTACCPESVGSVSSKQYLGTYLPQTAKGAEAELATENLKVWYDPLATDSDLVFGCGGKYTPAAPENADWVITKAMGANRRYKGIAGFKEDSVYPDYEIYDSYWTYSKGSSYNNSDSFEAVEIKNVSGKTLNLYDYGFAYATSEDAISKYTPFQAGNVQKPGSTWTWTNLPSGKTAEDVKNPVDAGSSSALSVAPGEVVVVWIVTSNTTGGTANMHMTTTSFDHFRGFHGIDDSIKVIAIDGIGAAYGGSDANFSFGNSAHNVLGIYNKNEVDPAQTNAFADSTESWIVLCGQNHTGEGALNGLGSSNGNHVGIYTYDESPLKGEQGEIVGGAQVRYDPKNVDHVFGGVIPTPPTPPTPPPAADTPDLLITKIMGANTKYTDEAYAGYNQFWTYSKASSDCYEAFELVNNTQNTINLYEYGLCWGDAADGVIDAYTPFQAGAINDGTTWTWSNLPEGQTELLNPTTLELAPGEKVVIWNVTGNTTGASAHLTETSFAHFRGFHGISDSVKVIAVDGTGSTENFNMKNSAHNTLGVYKKANVQDVTDNTKKFTETAESWAYFCCDTASGHATSDCTNPGAVGKTTGTNKVAIYAAPAADSNQVVFQSVSNYDPQAAAQVFGGVVIAIPTLPTPPTPPPAADTPDLLITKIMGANTKYTDEAYAGYNQFWTYSKASSDCYEAFELVNNTQNTINLYEYGLCWGDAADGVIDAYTPFQAGAINDGTTWTWSNLPEGQTELLNPTTLELAPGEKVVIWNVTGNTTGTSAHLTETSFAHFRGFHGISDSVKVIAVDGTGSTENFNMKNSAHNTLGVYKKANVQDVTDNTKKFTETAESWAYFCCDTASGHATSDCTNPGAVGKTTGTNKVAIYAAPAADSNQVVFQSVSNYDPQAAAQVFGGVVIAIPTLPDPDPIPPSEPTPTNAVSDLIITKVIVTTQSISGRSWPFNTSSVDGFEAIEIVNTSGADLNLYEYGLCYSDDDGGIIKAITPFKAGDFRDETSWDFNGLFEGVGNPNTCVLAPNEVAVLWLVNGDTTNKLKAGRGLKVSEFRNFYQIADDVKVICVDANSATTPAGGNFTFKNSAHNVLGIYKQSVNVVAGTTTFAAGADSWIVRCIASGHEERIATGKNKALPYIPLVGSKTCVPDATAELGVGSYAFGELTDSQEYAISAFEYGFYPAAPDFIITKAMASNRRFAGIAGFETGYENYDMYWTYLTGDNYNNSDSFEAVEIKNISNKPLNLYDYGFAYSTDEKTITNYTPFQAGRVQKPGSTWEWTNLPVGVSALNPEDTVGSKTLMIEPGETVVVWIVTANTTGGSASMHMPVTSFAHFRGFHGINDTVKVIAVDGVGTANGGAAGNFSLGNSVHNVIGIYNQNQVNVSQTNSFAGATESYAVICGMASHVGSHDAIHDLGASNGNRVAIYDYPAEMVKGVKASLNGNALKRYNPKDETHVFGGKLAGGLIYDDREDNLWNDPWLVVLMKRLARSYTVFASASEGGTISPLGLTKAQKKLTYTITPDENYVITNVLVDGVDVGAVSSYTFSGVTGEHTIVALFAHKSWIHTVSSTDKSEPEYADSVYSKKIQLFEELSAAANAEMNRQSLIMILWQMEGEPIVECAADYFDVAPNSEYANAIYWAAVNNVAVGYGNGLFGPLDTLTNEQMAIILYRYMRNNGMVVADAVDGNEAEVAYQWFMQSGLADLANGADLSPQAPAMYASAVYVLRGYLENHVTVQA